MISTAEPADFRPKFHVASCFVERNGEILLLLRLSHKSEGDKWGVPAGKIDKGETPLQAIIRETAEETGLDVPPDDMQFFKTYYVRYPDYDFVYHVFHARLQGSQQPRLKPDEHQQFRWATPKETLQLNLVTHQDVCTKDFYKL